MMQGHMPIGYVMIDGKIQFDDKKADVVKTMLQDYLSGAFTYVLAKKLTEMEFVNANNKVS